MKLVRAIEEQLATWDEVLVEPAIFGTAEPAAIAAMIEAHVEARLGTSIADACFYQTSVGAVAGVVLADGRRVVVKALAPHVRIERLAAVHDTMRGLAAAGFPCPTPLGAIAAIGQGHATIETLVDDGEIRDGHEPAVRRELARRLVELVALARVTPARAALGASWYSGLPADVLWPRPHSPLFDFQATAAGAEWIDAIAARARALPRHGATVVGHFDWRAEHARFAGDRMTVAYDWDSLHVDREPVVVGAAAHAFCANWEREDVAACPTADEMHAFIADYEDARGRLFDREERATLVGSLVYSTAYTARCVHALGAAAKPRGLAFVELLRQYGEQLLV